MNQEQTFYIVNDEVKHNAKAAIDMLDVNDKMVVHIETPKRSKAQNRLYWGNWVRTLVKCFGGSKLDIHDELREFFLGYHEYVSPFTGEVKYSLNSTTELTVKEFSEYLENIEAKMWHDYRLTMPHPEDYHLAVYGKL